MALSLIIRGVNDETNDNETVYEKCQKPALIRKITKQLRAMPKVKLARLCYNITKSKLPRLKTIKRKGLAYDGRIDKRRKKNESLAVNN